MPYGDILPSNDPPRLPDVRGPRKPVGYHAGPQLEERLEGLGLVLVGLLGVWLFASGALPVFSGRGPVPLAAPLACMVPLASLGSIALIGIGLRRVIAP